MRMVTVHEPVPVQPPPLHPVKVEPDAGDAVRVIDVPVGIAVLEQVEPQEIVEPETVPEPVPPLVTVRVNEVWVGLELVFVTPGASEPG